MAFKRSGRPNYYIGHLTVAGIHVPRLSTAVKNRRDAEAMESALLALAVGGYADLVRRVAAGDLPLAEVYAAKLGGDAALQELRDREHDHPLCDVIGTKPNADTGVIATGMYAVLTDERVIAGLDLLRLLIPEDARISWLRDPRNVTHLYQQAMRGEGGAGPRKPNTVRRSLHRAVAEILKSEMGRGRMLAIIADATVPGENDERTVMLSPDEIVQALVAADPEFRPVIGLAVTTGIDRSPCRHTRVRHYDPQIGVLQVVDDKAESRPRTLILRGEPLLENAEPWLRRLVAGRGGHEPLVVFSEAQIRSRWEAIRTVIGRPDVRWKDLRGIFATYYLRAGGDVRDLQHILGHSTMAMTLRYLRRLPVGNRERLREGARHVGQLGDGQSLPPEIHDAGSDE